MLVLHQVRGHVMLVLHQVITWCVSVASSDHVMLVLHQAEGK